MTTEEFKKEVNESKYKPKNFEKIYNEFQEYQKEAYETLKEFHRVCELNGVMYQLAYGSLLGAIRDGGQIPWDYDIDVFVPFEERKKLIAALNKDLNSKYYYYCPEVNPRCRHVMMRVTPKGYRSEVMHVDVFFLTGTPNDAQQRKEFCKEVKKTAQIRFYKLVKPFEEGKGHPRRMWKFIKGKARVLMCPLESATRRYYELCNQYQTKKSDICISADSFADWYEFLSEKVWNTKLIEVSGETFRVPEDYSYFLNIEYGNYISIPPIEKRINEMLVHYDRLKKFSRE